MGAWPNVRSGREAVLDVLESEVIKGAVREFPFVFWGGRGG